MMTRVWSVMLRVCGASIRERQILRCMRHGVCVHVVVVVVTLVVAMMVVVLMVAVKVTVLVTVVGLLCMGEVEVVGVLCIGAKEVDCTGKVDILVVGFVVTLVLWYVNGRGGFL